MFVDKYNFTIRERFMMVVCAQTIYEHSLTYKHSCMCVVVVLYDVALTLADNVECHIVDQER